MRGVDRGPLAEIKMSVVWVKVRDGSPVLFVGRKVKVWVCDVGSQVEETYSVSKMKLLRRSVLCGDGYKVSAARRDETD
jgi:hypothetical protein